MTLKNSWYSNSKFLITGEYLVMYGAKALALPLKFGQTLHVKSTNANSLVWKAYTPDGEWFSCEFSLPDLFIIRFDNQALTDKLQEILKVVSDLSPEFISRISSGAEILTELNFDVNYGMGSSSTLISNIAWWTRTDPYELLDLTFGGSGYDIACARTDSPILFSRSNKAVNIERTDFNPTFRDNIYFVYLGNKQSSSSSIKDFRKNSFFSNDDVKLINHITNEIINATDLKIFDKLIDEHESVLSSILKRPALKQRLFKDLPGSAKSLGAWGGDFVMITWNDSRESLKRYLKTKNMDVYFRFDEVVLNY